MVNDKKISVFFIFLFFILSCGDQKPKSTSNQSLNSSSVDGSNPSGVCDFQFLQLSHPLNDSYITFSESKSKWSEPVYQMESDPESLNTGFIAAISNQQIKECDQVFDGLSNRWKASSRIFDPKASIDFVFSLQALDDLPQTRKELEAFSGRQLKIRTIRMVIGQSGRFGNKDSTRRVISQVESSPEMSCDLQFKLEVGEREFNGLYYNTRFCEPVSSSETKVVCSVLNILPDGGGCKFQAKDVSFRELSGFKGSVSMDGGLSFVTPKNSEDEVAFELKLSKIMIQR